MAHRCFLILLVCAYLVTGAPQEKQEDVLQKVLETNPSENDIIGNNEEGKTDIEQEPEVPTNNPMQEEQGGLGAVVNDIVSEIEKEFSDMVENTMVENTPEETTDLPVSAATTTEMSPKLKSESVSVPEEVTDEVSPKLESESSSTKPEEPKFGLESIAPVTTGDVLFDEIEKEVEKEEDLALEALGNLGALEGDNPFLPSTDSINEGSNNQENIASLSTSKSPLMNVESSTVSSLSENMNTDPLYDDYSNYDTNQDYHMDDQGVDYPEQSPDFVNTDYQTDNQQNTDFQGIDPSTDYQANDQNTADYNDQPMGDHSTSDYNNDYDYNTNSNKEYFDNLYYNKNPGNLNYASDYDYPTTQTNPQSYLSPVMTLLNKLLPSLSSTKRTTIVVGGNVLNALSQQKPVLVAEENQPQTWNPTNKDLVLEIGSYKTQGSPIVAESHNTAPQESALLKVEPEAIPYIMKNPILRSVVRTRQPVKLDFVFLKDPKTVVEAIPVDNQEDIMLKTEEIMQETAPSTKTSSNSISLIDYPFKSMDTYASSYPHTVAEMVRNEEQSVSPFYEQQLAPTNNNYQNGFDYYDQRPTYQDAYYQDYNTDRNYYYEPQNFRRPTIWFARNRWNRPSLRFNPLRLFT